METLTLGGELLTGQVAGGQVAGRNIKSLFVPKLVISLRASSYFNEFS